jgi:protein TonB
MTTRRDPSLPTDDAIPRIVAHRLQKTGGGAVSAHSQVTRSTNGNGLHGNGSASTNGATHNRSGATTHGTDKPINSLRQVILVDRDIDALRDIAIALREEYDFHITISGNEALALLHDGSIDTIIVGQTLYSSTGLNVLSAARRSAPSTRRVLLASAVEASGIDRIGTGAAPFQVLQRPCTPDKLRELLETSAEQEVDATPQHSAQMATQAAAHRARQTLNPQSVPTLQVPSQPPPRPMPRPTPAPPPPLTHSALSHSIDPSDFEHVVMETAPERPRRSKARVIPNSADVHLPIIVYTDNAEFYQGVCAALQDQHDVRLATQIERVIEFAETGQCPILVTDRAGTQVELQRISIAVRALEPALMTIASGTMQEGQIFRKLIGTGALHSFLPKPLSPQLVRLAIEAARRQHLEAKYPPQPEEELKATATISPFKAPRPAAPTPAPPSPIYMPMNLSVDHYESFEWRRAVPYIGAIAAVLLVAAGGWYGWQQWTKVDPNDVAVKQELQRAYEAFNAGHLIEPFEGSAVYFYRAALKLDPNQTTAQQGLERIADTLIEHTERALLDEDVDKATQTIESLRELQPDHKRLAYFDAQLAKVQSYRERTETRVPPRVAEQPTVNRPARSASATTTPSASATTTSTTYSPISNEEQRQQAISRWLTSARHRISQGQLLRPENDSAEHYLRQVQRADPDNATAQQLLRDIGNRLLNDAQDAVSRQQLETAKRRISEATRFGGDPATISRLQRDIDSAASANARSQYLRLALQRARDNQLLEPDRDSAKYYLNQLQRIDATGTETQQALRAVALRLLDNANQAISQRQFNGAVRLINEARQLGYIGPELGTAETALRAARNPPPAPAAVRPLAAAPKVIKTVPPKFPDDAVKAGISGWVDVSMRILANGETTDVTAVASHPTGTYATQFERAAIAAIRQYKFEARDISDSETQRLVVRVQFQLQ